MTDIFYPSLQTQADGFEQHLNLPLNEMNSFNSSIQNIKDIKTFYNHEAKKCRKRNKRHTEFLTIYFNLLMEF